MPLRDYATPKGGYSGWMNTSRVGQEGVSELADKLVAINDRRMARERQSQIDAINEEDRQRKIKQEEEDRVVQQAEMLNKIRALEKPVEDTPATLKKLVLPQPTDSLASGTPTDIGGRMMDEPTAAGSAQHLATTTPLEMEFTEPAKAPEEEREYLTTPSGIQLPILSARQQRDIRERLFEEGLKEADATRKRAQANYLFEQENKAFAPPTPPAPKGYGEISDPYSGQLGAFDRDTGEITMKSGTGMNEANAQIEAPLMNAIGSASSNLSKDKRLTLGREVQRRVAAGDTEGAKNHIVESILANERVGVRGDIQARAETLGIMGDVSTILDDMAKRGVDTNILKGTAEDVVRKLGKTTNPEFASLANELKSALFAYRKAMTGVQFSVKESADYERMFPNYKNELPVNKALIRGLQRGFAIRNNTYWNLRVGKDTANYLGLVLDFDEPGSKSPESPQTPGALPPGFVLK